MSGFTEAALLREVARVQHDKTLQQVRDLVDSIKTTDVGSRGYGTTDRAAVQFRADLVSGLQRLRDADLLERA